MYKQIKKHKAVRHLASSPNRKSKKAKTLKWVAIGIFIFIILSIIALAINIYILEPKAKKQNNDIDQIRLELLSSSSTILSKGNDIIDSSLGFSVEYDPEQIKAQGQVTDPQSTNSYVFGETFENNELKDSRAYSIVKFRFKEKEESAEDNGGEPVIKPIKPELSIDTNIRKNYWESRAAEPENQGKSKLDIAVNANKKSALKSATLSVGEPKEIVVGDITYKVLEYTDKDSSFGVESTYRQTTYVTVQNDRPYFITISFINKSNESETKIFESIIASVRYKPLGENMLARSTVSIRQAAATDTKDLPESTTKTPYRIKPETIIDVILKNQPSVVRVASLYCANIDLINPDKSLGLNIEEACNGGVGSGSLISSDGYISTNGHVVSFTSVNAINGYIALSKTKEELRERASSMLNYLRSIKVIGAVKTEALINSALAGDAKAINILSNLGELIPPNLIEVKSERSDFAIQTSNNPIRLNAAQNSFEYNDTVVAAKFIDKNFNIDENKNQGGVDILNNTSSDVALLKVDGEFPFIELGEIKDIDEGDTLTAVGFPAFTDGGLGTKQKTTPPTATQGEVQAIFTKKVNQQKIVSTNVPIAQGNSGGPAFDAEGRQIGLNTYSKLTCADLKCFGNGMAVDIADLKNLINKKSIKLQDNGKINTEWKKALDSYEDGNYKKAIASFKKAKEIYPSNYLAEPLMQLAKSKVGSPSDTSDGLFNSSNLVILIGVLAFSGLGFGSWYLVHLHNGHRKNQGAIAGNFANQNLNAGVNNPPQSPANWQNTQTAPTSQTPPPPQQNYPPQTPVNPPGYTQAQPTRLQNAQVNQPQVTSPQNVEPNVAAPVVQPQPPHHADVANENNQTHQG